MLYDELLWQVRRVFGFEPTAGQEEAMEAVCRFLAQGGGRPVMIMRGVAGSGKTSVAGAVVRALRGLGRRMVLLAPTGRAAKVFALNAGCQAFTIHRVIYRQKAFTGGMDGFRLRGNMRRDTLFVVDEASMIANGEGGGARFGSGRLLDDLVEHVYSGAGCRLMLVGDAMQLPPVGEASSPALSADAMRGYGLQVYECSVDEVLRQAYGSGILRNATAIRRMALSGGRAGLPVIRFSGFADIQAVAGDELIDQLASSYSREGLDETIVITRSNKRARAYNHGIRASVLGMEEEVERGDMLTVVRNNYFWKLPPSRDDNDGTGADGMEDAEELGGTDLRGPAFIANGDRAEVRRVRNVRELYGLRFADMLLSFPDYGDMDMNVTAVLDTLTSDTPALDAERQERLFQGVLADHADMGGKAERLKAVKNDPLYNALQVKYAYAVTCHKAQGGQWAHVYIDQGFMTDDMVTPQYMRWLYTAFTRATAKLFLVNWPKAQTEADGAREA